MNRHLTDADLVALLLLPDDEPDMRMHLASCRECSSRMARAERELDRQRRELVDDVDSRDATFWKRQELMIMKEVARSRRPTAARRSLLAAAVVAVALGGFWFGRASVDEPLAAPSPAAAIARTTPSESAPAQPSVVVPASAVTTDPWESESLEEFQAVVDWESWVDDEGKDQGTI